MNICVRVFVVFVWTFFFSVSKVFLEQVDSVLGLLWKEMNKLNGFNLKIDKFLQNTIYQNRYRMKKEDWNNPLTSYLLSHNKSILKFSGLTQKHYFTVSVGRESARDLEEYTAVDLSHNLGVAV